MYFRTSLWSQCRSFPAVNAKQYFCHATAKKAYSTRSLVYKDKGILSKTQVKCKQHTCSCCVDNTSETKTTLAQCPAWGPKIRLQSGWEGTVWGRKQQPRHMERQQEQPRQGGKKLTLFQHKINVECSLFSSHNLRTTS